MDTYLFLNKLESANSLTSWFELSGNPLLREINSKEFLRRIFEKEKTNVNVTQKELIEQRLEFLLVFYRLIDGQRVILSSEDISRIMSLISGQNIHPKEMKLKTQVCDAVIKNISRSEQPKLWAIFQAEFAYSLMQEENNRENRVAKELQAEQAIRKSMDTFKQCEDSFGWALTVIQLGCYYLEREAGEKDRNLEEAIELLSEGYKYFSQNNMPEQLALASYNLGSAFFNRKYGKREENLQSALLFLTETIEISWERDLDQFRGRSLLQLANTHAAFSQEGNPKHFPLAVSYFRQVIDLDKSYVGDKIWSTAHYNLGTLLLKERGRRRPLFIREVIELFEKAIQSTDLELFPVEWANSLLAKAQAILKLDVVSFSLSNEVITLANKAKEVFSYHEKLDEVALCHFLIGRAIDQTIIEKSDEMKKQAIEHFRSALSYYEIKNDTDNIASIRGAIAHIEYTISEGNRSERIENSIRVFRENLTLFETLGNEEAFANTLNSLACCFIERIEGNRINNVTEAIGFFYRALDMCNKENDPDRWASLNVNLGNAYRELITEDYSGNINKSIEHYKTALEVIDKIHNPTMWANARIGLAAAYADCFDGNIVENFELALSQLREVEDLINIDDDPYTWAHAQISIGGILLDSPIGSKVNNIQTAMAHFLKAGQVIKKRKNSEKYADLLHKMGLAFSKVPSNSFAVEAAIDCYREALEFYTEENYPEKHALLNMRLGVIYWRRMAGDKDLNREESIKYLESGLLFFTSEKYPFDWALLKINLGSHYAERKIGNRLENLSKSKSAFEEALSKLNQEDFPDKRLACLESLAKVHFLMHDIPNALKLGMDFIDGKEHRLATSITDLDRIYHMSEGADVYEIVAYCLAEKNKLEDALIILDKGKARLLSEWLYLLDIDITKLSTDERNVIYTHLNNLRQKEMRLKQSDWYSGYSNVANSELIQISREGLFRYLNLLKSRNPTIVKIAPDMHKIIGQVDPFTGVVFPIITDMGSKLIITWHEGDKNIKLVEIKLGGLTRSNIYEYLRGNNESGGFLECYNNYKRSRTMEDRICWLESIDEVTRHLWVKLVSKLCQKIKELGIQKIIMVTQGILQLLPIHAAWHYVNKQKCYLIDEIDIAYVPNLRSLARSLEHLSTPTNFEERMIAVVNPTGDLAFAEREGLAISQLFEGVLQLPRNNIVLSDIINNAKSSSFLHFACHGSYNAFDPWRSGLQVSEGEFMSLDIIMTKLNLDNIRLVTLSACESGIADFNQVPNEYIGLPLGFIYAGAPAVVSSLWMVDDYATSLLMERLYQNIIKEKMSPLMALCSAQRWLKNATNIEIKASIAVRGSPVEKEYYERMESKFKRKDNQKPFSHPYYWSAFTITGS